MENLGAKFSIDISDLKAGLAQANRLMKESTSEFKAAAAGMDDWRSSEDGLNAKLKQLSSTLDVQKEVLRAYEEQYREAGYAQDDMSKEAVELRTKINNQKAAIAETEKETARYSEALDELENSSSEASEAIEDVGEAAKKTSGGFSVMKGALANLISNGIQTAVGAIKGLVGEAVSASDSLYKFEQTMGFAGYDDKTVKKAKADMKDYADKTVYDLETISSTTAQLAANGIKDFTGLTQAAGNLNAVAGGNAETFQSVGMVLTQTAGAGKLTTENWNQLANAIPGASGKLQEAMLKSGAYTGNFREAMEKGEITADEFNAAIMELGNEPVAVEAATSVETFEGAMGNLQATVVDGLMKIIDAIGMENITGFITKANDGISKIVKVIPKISKGFKSGFGWLKDNLPAIVTLLGGVTAALLAFKSGTIAVKALSAATKIQTGVQAALNAVMNANPIGLIILAITALVAAFMLLWKNCEGFRKFWINLWDGIKKGFSAFVSWISNACKSIGNFFSNLGSGIKKTFGNIGSWFSNVFSSAANGVKNAFSSVKSFFSNIWSGIKSTFSNVGSWFTEKFRAAYNGITNIFSKLGSFFSGIWSTISTTFSSLGTKIGDAIGGAVKTAINGVISKIETTINKAIGIINGAIDLINKLPIAHVGKVKTVSFPRLAKGGVVSQATTAVIGEDGKEAVVPLERNLEWIDKVADKVAEKMGGKGGSVVVNQTNNYSQAHSRYEMYKSKQQTAAAVRLALQGG